jgi:hypothetical protein
MEYFQDALDLAFYDQRYTTVTFESFPLDKFLAGKMHLLILEIPYGDNSTLLRDPA